MVQQLLRKIFLPASPINTQNDTPPQSLVLLHCCGNVDCGDCDSGRHHWCTKCTISLGWRAPAMS